MHASNRDETTNANNEGQSLPDIDFNPGLLKQQAAADFLDCEPNTLAKWRITGQGPPFIKLGRSVRYDRADLLEWIASCKVRSTSEAA